MLRGASYELDDGTAARVDGLMLEMWRVFEVLDSADGRQITGLARRIVMENARLRA